MQLNLLERSVLATIAYYDVLDYPLTGFESYLTGEETFPLFSIYYDI